MHQNVFLRRHLWWLEQ